MKPQKNLAAKITAIAASLLALVGTLALVHRNPPAAADTNAQAPAAASSRPLTRQSADESDEDGAAPAQPSASTHTRTHVS